MPLQVVINSLSLCCELHGDEFNADWLAEAHVENDRQEENLPAAGQIEVDGNALEIREALATCVHAHHH